METAPVHPLVQVTQEEMEMVRQRLNIDRHKIRQNLDVIKEWVKKEEHLAEGFKYLDQNILERLHIIEKGSVEKTKKRIDKLLTTRAMLPEICLNKSFEEFEELNRNVIATTLPKLHPGDLTRIRITQLKSPKGNEMNLINYIRFAILMVDYTMKYDYNLGERYILDLKHFNATGVGKFNPFILKKGEILCLEGYGIRLKGVHIVNATSFVDQVLSLLKRVCREKVAKRFHVHRTFEDLHKEIPKEVLPEEYGGDLENSASLLEKWKTTLATKEARQVIENANKLVADNSKRSSYQFNTEYLGMPGSFTQLVVD